MHRHVLAGLRVGARGEGAVGAVGLVVLKIWVSEGLLFFVGDQMGRVG